MTTPSKAPAALPLTRSAKQWSDDRNEDWAKRTWDVRTASGDVVDSLDSLALVLGKSREQAAEALMRWPSGAAAPTALREEAEAVLKGDKPGGAPAQSGTFDVPGVPGIVDRSHLGDVPAPKPPKAVAPPAPKAPAPPPPAVEPEPEVKRGDAVTWSGGSGRVDLVVKRGVVPGAPNVVYGREATPAVRVVLQDGSKAAVLARDVTVIDDTPQVDVEGKGAGGLVTLVAAYQESEGAQTPPWARVTGTAVKAAFARGKASYPGADVTVLDVDAWALGRVKAFLTLLTRPEQAPAGYTRDLDLLPPGHPARTAGGR